MRSTLAAGRPQPDHRDDAERRPRREERERPAPADGALERRDQPDRRDGEREAHCELERERGADVGLSACSVTRVENCAESATTVKPQTRRDGDRRPTSAGGRSRARRRRARHQAAVVSARPSRSPSTPPTTQPSAPTPITANVASAAPVASREERVAGEDEEPRPHRVQLPHVAEVAERREPHAAVGEHAADLAGVERPPRERVRPFAARRASDEHPADDASAREVDGDHGPPVEPAEAVDEVRRAPSRA